MFITNVIYDTQRRISLTLISIALYINILKNASTTFDDTILEYL